MGRYDGDAGGAGFRFGEHRFMDRRHYRTVHYQTKL